MNALRGTFLGLTLALPLAALPAQQAQEATATQTVTGLARSANDELQKSIAELTALREQIATEKLPLAEELTKLEDELSQLRREHDRITRLVDEGSLERANLETEMKARRDELAYDTNLLDEYARNFESKVHPTELQYCGKAIETAKQATANPALSQAEKFAQQVELVKASVQRSFDALGGMKFDGEGVDLQGGVLAGQFAMIGPVALFRSSTGVAGLVVPQAGSPLPLIRPLEGEVQQAIAPLVQNGEGSFPFDPSRGGALKALIHNKFSLVHIFEKGGPIMWPLLVCSVLALGVVLERLLFLANEKRKRKPKALEALYAAVQRGDMAAAIEVAKQTKFYVVRALGYALSHREQSLPNALVYAQAQELKRFKRGIPILDTVITLAPLLGLLGTVTGMMGSFSLIGGELSAPGAITGGIAEALIATAFGLGIAITALIPFNFLNSKLDEASHEIESAATQLELLVQGKATTTAVSPVASTGAALATA